jgi:integrase
MKVSDAITVYLAQREGELQPLTLRSLRYTLNKLSAVHGHLELADLDAGTVREWRNNLPVAPTSANKYADRVRAFMNYAREQGWLERGMAKVNPLTVEPKRPLRLDIDQIAALLDQASNQRDRAMLAVSMEWLLRGHEIAILRVGHLRGLTDDVADVRVMKTEGVWAWDEMVVTDSLRLELENWLHAYRVHAGGPLADDAYLFPRLTSRLNGTAGREIRLYPQEQMSHPYLVVSRALTAIGADVGRQGFHTIRRSMARIRYDALVEAGTPDPVGIVSALLHHKSRKTTELYLGVDGDRDRRNALMRSTSWVSALPTATIDKRAGQAMARVIPLRG